MFYNVYIEHKGDKRQYIIALSEQQVNSLVTAHQSGKEKIMVKGVERYLANPAKFIISSITDNTLGDTQEEIEHNFHTLKLHNSSKKINQGMFQKYGANVTDKFLIDKDWSMRKRTATGKIFISHSSKDKIIVEKFVDHILILGLGITRQEIFCTSIDGADIKSGQDFKRAIYEELNQARVVFQFITKNYKSSEVCLNEMGAAWILSKHVIPLIASPFNFDVGFIHASTQQLLLSEEQHIIKLYDDHKTTIFKSEINMSNLWSQVRKFVNDLKKNIEMQEDETDNVSFYDEESVVVGTVRGSIFQHPNKSYHRYFYLEINPPIDVLSSNITMEEGNHNLSTFGVHEIQIVPEQGLEKNSIKNLENKKVRATGKFWGGHTAWHQTKIMMSVSAILLIE